MSLDDLYGPGTAAEFSARVDLTAVFPGSKAAITEQDSLHGFVAVEVVWTDARGERIGNYKLEYHREVVACSWLGIEPAYRRRGLNTHLIRSLEPWWPTLGLKAHTMLARQGTAGEQALRAVGYTELPDGSFGTPLPAPRPREFLDWVAAGALPADEPAWRRAPEPDMFE